MKYVENVLGAIKIRKRWRSFKIAKWMFKDTTKLRFREDLVIGIDYFECFMEMCENQHTGLV